MCSCCCKCAAKKERPVVVSLGCKLTVISLLTSPTLKYFLQGESNRIISHHQLNKFSSRSHCIFSIFMELRSRTMSSEGYSLSKLNLVDLAGSERIGKTLAEGKAQEEAMHINKSLTFLEQAVIALADQKREHVPYRQSKLTHVLKDSIGGSCQTVMIGNIWGEFGQLEETVNTTVEIAIS